MITSFHRIIILLAIFALLLTLLPVLPGFIADEDPEDDDFSILNSAPFAWSRNCVQHSSILLTMGLSIFVLLVVYRGGRSKHRRFNDRTLDTDMLSKCVCISLKKTARYGAVFNFLNFWLAQAKALSNIDFVSTYQGYGGT